MLLPVGIPIESHTISGSVHLVLGTAMLAWANANDNKACTPTSMASDGTLNNLPMALQPYMSRKDDGDINKGKICSEIVLHFK